MMILLPGYRVKRLEPIEELGSGEAEARKVFLFDAEQLREACSNKVPLMLKVVERYIATSLASLAEIDQSAASQNTVGLVGAAHALKGSSWTVGSSQVGDVCQHIERAAREGSVETEMVQDLDVVLPRLIGELQNFARSLT